MNQNRVMYWMAGAVLLAAIAAPVAAQQRPSLERLAERLELSDEQAAEIKATMGEADGQRDLWAMASMLQSTLNAQQKEKLLDRGRMAGAFSRGVRAGSRARSGRGARAGSRAQRTQQGRGQQRRGARRSPIAGTRADFNGLELTDDQKEQLKTANEQHRNELRELRAARQSGELDTEVLRERTQALQASMKESRDAVLTEEQQEVVSARGARARRAGQGVRRPGQGARRPGQGVQRPRQGMQRPGQGVRRPGQGRSGQPRRGIQRDTPSRSNTNGMGDALNLSHAQEETVAIHRALAAGMSAQFATPRQGRRQFGRRAPR